MDCFPAMFYRRMSSNTHHGNGHDVRDTPSLPSLAISLPLSSKYFCSAARAIPMLMSLPVSQHMQMTDPMSRW